MKFRDIKVGDSVMQCTVVSLGIGCRPSFFIPIKVARVTPKRFVLENGEIYNKKDGTGVGHRYSVHSVEKQEDQTEAMNKAIKKRNNLQEIWEVANLLSKSHNVEPHFEELYKLLEPISVFLKEKGIRGKV